MNYRFILLWTAFFQWSLAGAQKNFPLAPSEKLPHIDGILEDSAWLAAESVRDFTTALPRFNQTPGHGTEVKILQCREGLAVAVNCETNRIRFDGSFRDDPGTADYFTISLDTWNDDQNAFTFTVTAFGQKMDGRLYSGGEEREYDVYWSAKVKRYANGWTAEMFIPWTALRFPVRGPQHWGLQLTRFDRSTGETSTWSPDDPLIEDKVLQYGEIILQEPLFRKMRAGISWLGQLDWNRVKDTLPQILDFNNDFQASVFDASLGISSSATLDINFLHYSDGYNGTIFGSYLGANFFESRYLPTPRRFDAEESGIFQKNRVYDPDPFFTVEYLLPQLAQSPILALNFNNNDPRPIGNVKFTARTKNNFGIGIVNRIFEQPILDVFNFSTFLSENIEYPVRPNANQITIEKALPNNSWIQLSNSNFYAGKNLNSNRSGITTQLRDKTNRFQLRGGFRWQSEKTKASERFSVADGSIGLYKINGTWTGGLGYQSLPRVRSEFVTSPDGFYEGSPGDHRIFSSVSKNNFQSGRKPLNSTSTLFAEALWNKGMSNIQRGRVGLRERRLARNFSEWTAEISVTPFSKTDTVALPIFFLYRSLPPSLALQATYATDLRKKWTVQTTFLSHWHTGSNIFNSGIGISPRWVVHSKITLLSSHTLHYFNRLSGPGIALQSLNLIEDVNSIALTNRLGALFQPVPGFRLQAHIGMLRNRPSWVRIFQLTPDSKIIPWDAGAYKPLTPDNLSSFLDLNAQWVVGATSILNFTARWNNESGTITYQGPNGVWQYDVMEKGFRFNVSWSLNLYRR